MMLLLGELFRDITGDGGFFGIFPKDPELIQMATEDLFQVILT